MTSKTQTMIEASLGVRIQRGWILDGAGPARFGWAAIEPCRSRFLGRTLAQVSDAVTSPLPKGDIEVDKVDIHEPLVGTWASVARMMADGDDSGFDWDAWKDQMKDESW